MDNEKHALDGSGLSGTHSIISPGSIVVLCGDKPHQKESPWIDAEGLLLGYSDGYARVFWYKEPIMTLHWNPEHLRMKTSQDISSNELCDSEELLNSLKRYLEDGLVRF